MTVIVPHVEGLLHPRTRAWADGEPGAELWQVSTADEHGYWRLIHGHWLDSEADLVIVEQDMLPAGGVVGRMLGCRRPWCSSPYEVANRTLITDGLGCVRFAARLKDRHPDLMDVVGRIEDDGLPARDWRRLDTRITRTLRSLGYRPHVHARSEHLHDYRARP